MLQNPHRQRCDALRKGQRARAGPGAACFPMTPPPNGGNCTIRGATRRRHAVVRLLMLQTPHHYPWRHAPQLLQDCPARRWLNALARHLQSKAIQARERAQIRTIKGGIRRVEVFQMDGVGISIIETPRPLHNHDTPNPAQHTKTFYTLTCEEPVMCLPGSCGALYPCDAGPQRQACATTACQGSPPDRKAGPGLVAMIGGSSAEHRQRTRPPPGRQ